MKNSCILLLFFGIIYNSFSQSKVSFGVKGGANISNVTNASFDSKTNAYFGGFLNIHFSQFISQISKWT